ncbi:MAG: hypothetical protein IJD92_04640 [Bacilli bacterium]|nr:hypothetical protein [Bacilli bacterium]
MYCYNCGQKNNKESMYCFNCGNKLYESAVKSSGNKETSLVLGIICLISSFFFNILCFVPGIISIIYAKKYKKESSKLGIGFGLSLGGMIFSLIIMILFILLIVFIFINFGELSIEPNYPNLPHV